MADRGVGHRSLASRQCEDRQLTTAQACYRCAVAPLARPSPAIVKHYRWFSPRAARGEDSCATRGHVSRYSVDAQDAASVVSCVDSPYVGGTLASPWSAVSTCAQKGGNS